MDINGIENITLLQIKKIYELDKMKFKDGIIAMRKFCHENCLTYEEGKKIFSLSKIIFDKLT